MSGNAVIKKGYCKDIKRHSCYSLHSLPKHEESYIFWVEWKGFLASFETLRFFANIFWKDNFNFLLNESKLKTHNKYTVYFMKYFTFYKIFPPLYFFLLVKISFTLNVLALQLINMFSEKCNDKIKFVGILKKMQILYINQT